MVMTYLPDLMLAHASAEECLFAANNGMTLYFLDTEGLFPVNRTGLWRTQSITLTTDFLSLKFCVLGLVRTRECAIKQ